MNEVRTRGRWKGKTPKQVSAAMRKLAKTKAQKMSPEQKQRNAQRMVAARGTWVIVEGKKTYVRKQR